MSILIDDIGFIKNRFLEEPNKYLLKKIRQRNDYLA